ncbi:hypothetical protein TVAG_001670 [Trichomonas vaginalis G3]|uniref:Uncharacterized protein n=1 Tax=Trichomonas vaginalis (strain ATCC PRA-98 / G3) TaxID=412133 RepID=A2FSX5_TRIV3|nr:hypothetical protein TVAGG3_0315900 [Trichomonas vaginalis G3]EAX91997.1 hypothetical protein TVAG_001670 [Trichomonas vaginalis G3]KAI5528952.1 hypothetical protein TVAGG3_0315900 [Trichomonas vaginalis G3]|eukprot:XP_001304927.1 hypothetical protein [Trichomonas vaginalis G3]
MHLELHPRMSSSRNIAIANENLNVVHDCIQNVITITNNESDSITITDSSFKNVDVRIQHSNVTFNIPSYTKNKIIPPSYSISNSNVTLTSFRSSMLNDTDIYAEIELINSEITFTPNSEDSYIPVNLELTRSSIKSNGELKLPKLSLDAPKSIDGNVICSTLGVRYQNYDFSDVTALFVVTNLELFNPSGQLPLKINVSDSISVYNNFSTDILNLEFKKSAIKLNIYLDQYSLFDSSKLIVSNVQTLTDVNFNAIYNGTSYLNKEQAEKILPGTKRTLVQFKGNDSDPIRFDCNVEDSNLSKYINLEQALKFESDGHNSVIMTYVKTPASTTQILCYATDRNLCKGMTILKSDTQKAPDYVDRVVLHVFEGFSADFYLNFNLTNQPVDFVIEGSSDKVQVVNINLTSDTRYILKSLEFKAIIAKFRFDTPDKSVNLKKLIVDEYTLFMPSEIYNFDSCDLIVCHISAVRLFQTNRPKFEVNLVPYIGLNLNEKSVDFYLNNQLITSIQNEKLDNYKFRMVDNEKTIITEEYVHSGSDIFLHLIGEKPKIIFRTKVPNNESTEYIEISDGTEINIDTMGFAPIRINNFARVAVDTTYSSELVQISSLKCKDLECTINNSYTSSVFFKNVFMEGKASIIGVKQDINVVILSLQVNEKSKAEISNVQLVNSVDIEADSSIVLGDVQIGNTKFHVHPHQGDQNYQIYINTNTYKHMSPSEVNVSFIEQEKQCTNATKIVQSQYALAEN